MRLEAVVEVVGVGAVDRPAVLDAAWRHEAGVEERHGEDHQRHDERDQGVASSACPRRSTAPSSRPSRFDPQSPMKTDAGWKLWTRKPSAAPAVMAARTPAASSPEVERDDREGDRAIAQTPAARPSTPSEKLTTFINAARGRATVSGAADVAEVDGADEREREVVTSTPADDRDRRRDDLARRSLTAGCRSKTSSSAPTSVISAAPEQDRRASLVVGQPRTAPATSTPAKIARPPSSGVAALASPRSRGASTAPTRRASRATSGVSAAVAANARRRTRRAHRAASSSPSRRRRAGGGQACRRGADPARRPDVAHATSPSSGASWRRCVRGLQVARATTSTVESIEPARRPADEAPGPRARRQCWPHGARGPDVVSPSFLFPAARPRGLAAAERARAPRSSGPRPGRRRLRPRRPARRRRGRS